MSSEELMIVENILEGFLNPQKEIRDQAQIKFNELSSNFPALIFCLSKVILESNNTKNRTFACVAMRKLVESKDNEIGNPKWEKIDNQLKETIKTNLINALINNTEPSLNNKICDTICTVASSIFELEEKWEQLINYIATNFSVNINLHNTTGIENSLNILSQVYFMGYDELSNLQNIFITSFKNYFATDSLPLKTKTLVCISEMISSTEKKNLKIYRQFSMNILETVLKCAENTKEENNLLLCLEKLLSICQDYPIMFKKHFSDIFILMGKLIEKTDYLSDNIRDMSFEVILSLVTKYPILLKDDSKSKILIELIFKFALEMEVDITNEWMNPKTDSLVSEDVIPEEKLNSALILLERLIESAENEENVLALIADIIMMFIKNESHWKYKYIGFMTVSHIIEFINDMKNISHIFNDVFANLSNFNPKIKFACLECINAFSDHFQPDFQNAHYVPVINGCLQLFKDSSLRIRMESCYCLESFFESVNDQVALEYCETILNEIFTIFLQDEVQVCLIDSLVNLSCEIVRALEDKFKPYSEKCMEIFCNFLFKIFKMRAKSSLFGPLLVVITTIGPICKETFEKFLPDLIQISVDLQNNVADCSDPILKSLQVSWEPMISIINEKYTNLIPQIIESSLKLITKTPKVSVSSNPESKFDLGELLTEGKTEDNTEETKRMDINTAEMNDLTDSIELINVFIEGFDKHFVPYIEFTEQTIIPLNKYDANSSVRGVSITVFEVLANLVIKYSSVEVAHAKVKNYISIIFEAMEKEEDNENVITMLKTLENILEEVKLFLTTPEINSLFSKLIEIFNGLEKQRLDLIRHKEQAQKDLDTDKANVLKSGEDESDNEFEDEEEDLDMLSYDIKNIESILTGFSNVIGNIFKHHKELCMEVVNKLLVEYLPKYFLDSSSNFEKKLGFFILDDMIEFLGQDLLYSVWSDIFQLLIKFSNSNISAIRQAVVYGIGEFCKYTKKNFENYYAHALNALVAALDVQKTDNDSKEEFLAAKDNSVSSIGKIIKYHAEKINLKETINKWVQSLPIEVDKVEAIDQYEMLCEIILNKSEFIVGENNSNLVKIICVLGKIYQTLFTNDSINEKIKIIMKNFKDNSSLHVYVEEAIKQSDIKVKDKITEFFK